MILPGAYAIMSPLTIGLLVGPRCLAGLLGGSIVSGCMLAIMMSNAGGAWDNSKKYIEIECIPPHGDSELAPIDKMEDCQMENGKPKKNGFGGDNIDKKDSKFATGLPEDAKEYACNKDGKCTYPMK